jgi:uncharacterized repeat protein (TIGR03803 family)
LSSAAKPRIKRGSVSALFPRQQISLAFIQVEETLMLYRTLLRPALGITLGSLLVATTASAQTSYSVVAPLADGLARPMGGVIKATNGVFYGTAYDGGSAGCGGVFKVAPDGTLTMIHTFSGNDGCHPVGELVQSADGHLYGTTWVGGPHADLVLGAGTGTIFRISLPGETFQVLHAFAPFDAENQWYPEGVNPFAGLTVGPGGALYGITNAGGPQPNGLSCFGPGGTFFKVTPAGVEVLYTLDASSDGCGANAGLTLGPDGNFYGTTAHGGGLSAAGTIFRVSPEGIFTKLFAFVQHAACICWADGSQPVAEPVLDSDGNIYGTASGGGPAGTGSGTIWKLSPSGQLTVLKAFSGAGSGLDGSFPTAGLTWGSDGLLYGTTLSGGPETVGTVFRITTSGSHEVLHTFDISDGAGPDGRLIETSPGVFIGTAQQGSDLGGGVVFQLTVPIVDLDVNGQDGPVTLGTGDPFQLSISFQANDAGVVNPARVYIGVAAPFGLLWLTPSGFGTTPAALYTGPLPTFAPATLLNLPNAAVLPAGTYVWFAIVDTDGPGDSFDFVQVTVSP